MVNHW